MQKPAKFSHHCTYYCQSPCVVHGKTYAKTCCDCHAPFTTLYVSHDQCKPCYQKSRATRVASPETPEQQKPIQKTIIRIRRTPSVPDPCTKCGLPSAGTSTKLCDKCWLNFQTPKTTTRHCPSCDSIVISGDQSCEACGFTASHKTESKPDSRVCLDCRSCIDHSPKWHTRCARCKLDQKIQSMQRSGLTTYHITGRYQPAVMTSMPTAQPIPACRHCKKKPAIDRSDDACKDCQDKIRLFHSMQLPPDMHHADFCLEATYDVSVRHFLHCYYAVRDSALDPSERTVDQSEKTVIFQMPKWFTRKSFSIDDTFTGPTLLFVTYGRDAKAPCGCTQAYSYKTAKLKKRTPTAVEQLFGSDTPAKASAITPDQK